MVTGIAAYHSFRIFDSFEAAFGADGDPELYNVGYRYVDWLLTVPLLGFLCSAPVWGALSTIPFLCILYVLFIELSKSRVRQWPKVRKLVSNLRLLLLATWGA